MKTQGEIESAICEGVSRFEQEYMGRGPKDIRAHLIGDLVVIRLQGVLTAAEQHLVQTLRAECPWDREQTHVSLRRHLIEEAYEVLDAIDGFDPATGDGADHLEEELGDLLFQVFLHAVMGAEEGWFDLADVARTVHDKLHRRHPHVFGDVEVAGTDELVVSWEAQKLSEKGRDSVLDGVASALPALSFAEKTLKKSGAIGAPLASERVAALAGAVSAAAEAPDDTTIGRALFALVAGAREAGVDPEMALRAEIARTGDRVRRYETLKAAQPDASPAQLWSAASPASDL